MQYFRLDLLDLLNTKQHDSDLPRESVNFVDICHHLMHPVLLRPVHNVLCMLFILKMKSSYQRWNAWPITCLAKDFLLASEASGAVSTRSSSSRSMWRASSSDSLSNCAASLLPSSDLQCDTSSHARSLGFGHSWVTIRHVMSCCTEYRQCYEENKTLRCYSLYLWKEDPLVRSKHCYSTSEQWNEWVTWNLW